MWRLIQQTKNALKAKGSAIMSKPYEPPFRMTDEMTTLVVEIGELLGGIIPTIPSTPIPFCEDKTAFERSIPRLR